MQQRCSGAHHLAVLICVLSVAIAVDVTHASSEQQNWLENAAFFTGESPEGGVMPQQYLNQTQTIWVKEAQGFIPQSFEVVVALLWVTLFASLPLILVKLEGKSVTHTQLSVFAVMWIVFLGGLYLFTHVLLFQSIHFKRVRTLTLVECVYLMSQIVTTVGYGDITPAKPRGQVFVAIYVVISLIIIANVLSDVTKLIASRTESYVQRLEETALHRLQVHGLTPRDGEKKPLSLASKRQEVPELPWRHFLHAAANYAFWCCLGVVFFVNYPGENKTLFQAVYMSIITMSTVGFGAFTPQTKGGMVFGAFWMIIGSFSLVELIAAFTELMACIKVRERWSVDHATWRDQAFNQLPERVDLHTFVKFGLLHTKSVHEAKLAMIDETFKQLGPGHDGKIDKEAACKLLDLEGRAQ